MAKSIKFNLTDEGEPICPDCGNVLTAIVAVYTRNKVCWDGGYWETDGYGEFHDTDIYSFGCESCPFDTASENVRLPKGE